jgi:N-acetylglucosaminyl-diphospho-decaprenol L-rhamnosyltransferase
MSKLVIQIALYHGSQYLHPLLRSLEAQTFEDLEVIFYENSVDEQELARVQIHLANFTRKHRLIVGSKNLGFSAHNELYRMTMSPFVLVLNQDAYLEPDCLQKMLATVEADATIASATPVVLRWYDKPTDEIDTVGLDYVCLGMVRDSRRLITGIRDHSGIEVWGVSGAVGLYRRASVDAVRTDGNLYDPRFFMYKEDVELAFRLHHAGMKSVCVSDARAYHVRAIRESPRGILNRILAERKRPKHLRIAAYRNQWRIYQMHWREITLRDKLLTIRYEVARTALFLLAYL